MSRSGGEFSRVARFVAVGTSAAFVHWLVVVAAVEAAAVPPLLANVAGWLSAFGVSFAGHHRLTFAGHGGSARGSAARFFAISATGFAINESAYALMTRLAPEHYALSLAFVLVAVAAITYRLSRVWAFVPAKR